MNSGTITLTHDPEGSVQVTTVPNIYPPSGGPPVTETLTNTLNVRGELVGEQWSPNNPQMFPHQAGLSSAGYLSMISVPNDGSPSTCVDNADYVNTVRVELSCPSDSATFGSYVFPQGTDDAFTFDVTGRQTVHTKTANQFTSYQMPPPRDAVTVGMNTKTVTTITNAYNAENRIASFHPVVVVTNTNASTNQVTTNTTDHGISSIRWGPNDHPAVVQNGDGSAFSLHWDGDMMLFVTDSSGNVVDFKAGLDGEVSPNDTTFSGINAYDRDPAGVIIATNNSSGTSGMQPMDPSLPAANTAASPGFKRGSPFYWYRRSDGFEIGVGVFGAPPIQINGVRAFNSTLGSWTTPDAFEGDIHDPSSQQRYMWNRNNAYDYNDPSGYCVPACLAIPLAIGGGPELLGDAVILAGGAAAGAEINEHGKQIVDGTVHAAQGAASALGDMLRGSSGGPGAGKRFPESVRSESYKNAGGKCERCGAETKRKGPSGPNKAEAHHIFPRSRGGNNTIDNAANLCRTCNRALGAKIPPPGKLW